MTIHLRKKGKRYSAKCGFDHKLGVFTSDKDKATCPQCLRVDADRHAKNVRNSEARKRAK